ncbi:hypothetical protein CEXT_737991 [Caerostris extrusa]|uniref:Uncharacterized protein n=1 Tax=Caerostris extrusa TaxID=172846 RepID=A0AAV4XCZ0_CAEEX|nr:hypothetical protein CEXT_737991 [Caerostris extrusa]
MGSRFVPNNHNQNQIESFCVLQDWARFLHVHMHGVFLLSSRKKEGMCELSNAYLGSDTMDLMNIKSHGPDLHKSPRISDIFKINVRLVSHRVNDFNRVTQEDYRCPKVKGSMTLSCTPSHHRPMSLAKKLTISMCLPLFQPLVLR